MAVLVEESPHGSSQLSTTSTECLQCTCTCRKKNATLSVPGDSVGQKIRNKKEKASILIDNSENIPKHV